MPKYVVRTGVMRALGVYSSGRDDTYSRGNEVVVRSDRGMEIGEVLCEATEGALAQLKDAGQGQILRTMSNDDARERSRLFDEARREIQLRLDREEQRESDDGQHYYRRYCCSKGCMGFRAGSDLKDVFI